MANTPEPPLSALPDDPTLLQAMIRELLLTLHERDQELQGVRLRLDALLRRLYGPRAEKIDPSQGSLFEDVPPPAPPPAPPLPAAPAPTAKGSAQRGHGRRRLPASLRRVRQEHALSEAECACPACGTARCKIAEDISEQLDYQPASLFVVQHVRFVYACPECQGCVTTAPPPAQPIARGLPGAGLLAHIAVSKYLDHLPLYRLERIFGRHGLELPRQTSCDWMAALAELVTPLYELLKRQVLASGVVGTDDTPVPVLEPGRGSTKQGRLWAYLGDAAHPATVFDYTPDRCRAGPAQFLGNYQGFLQADAYAGYDHLFAAGRVVEVGCWAHARRNFFEHKDANPALAHAALARIGQLYAVEAEAKELRGHRAAAGQDRAQQDEAVRLLRQHQAVPLLTALGAWLKEQRPQLLPRDPLRGAIDYCLNQWPALVRYSEHGCLAIDNNATERALRGVAVGRKNWLFAGSDAGGRTAAILYSLMASAQRAAVEAFAWLRDVINRRSAGPLSAEALGRLLPSAWQAPA